MHQTIRGTLTGHVDRDGRRIQFDISISAEAPNRQPVPDMAPATAADQAALNSWYADLVQAVQSLSASVSDV